MYDFYDDEYVVEEKAKIRKAKRRARASFVGEERAAADEAIYNKFMSLRFIKDYESFFIYNSVNSEADTKRLIKTLADMGKKIYLPRVMGKYVEAVPLSDKLIKSPFGIEEPVGNAYMGHIDAAVVPAFALDLHGWRVGYGGGYYDRFLANRKIFKIGYCYDFQRVRSAPAASHDIPMDYILTDKTSRYAIGSEAEKAAVKSAAGWATSREGREAALKAPDNIMSARDNDTYNSEETEDETEDN